MMIVKTTNTNESKNRTKKCLVNKHVEEQYQPTPCNMPCLSAASKKNNQYVQVFLW